MSAITQSNLSHRARRDAPNPGPSSPISSTRSAARSACALTVLAFAGLCLALATPAWAGSREQARRIHDRLVGVPPDDTTLDQMQLLIEGGATVEDGAVAAALFALEHPDFYRTQLRVFATPWTNVDQTPFAPLNDFTATVIGVIRDGRPFTDVLTTDLVYRGANGVVPSGYSQTNNDHYEELQASNADLGDPNVLVDVRQSQLPNSQINAGEAAGVLTTRAAGEAFFSAGTNRRMWRYTAMNFLCRDMEDLKDLTRPADRIRQDVSRSPGGDSQLFLNDCVGCHNGMDPMAQAFAFFEWDADAARVVHSRGDVQPKYLINDNVFPGGYVTTTNRWDNMWRDGPHQHLDWDADLIGGGWGAQSLGEEVAMSEAFAICKVEQVYEHVCFREPANATERTWVRTTATSFMNEWSYDMKRVFAAVSTQCMGN